MGSRAHITADEAIACLPYGDTIHTVYARGFMLGADWDRADVIAALADYARLTGGRRG